MADSAKPLAGETRAQIGDRGRASLFTRDGRRSIQRDSERHIANFLRRQSEVFGRMLAVASVTPMKASTSAAFARMRSSARPRQGSGNESIKMSSPLSVQTIFAPSSSRMWRARPSSITSRRQTTAGRKGRSASINRRSSSHAVGRLPSIRKSSACRDPPFARAANRPTPFNRRRASRMRSSARGNQRAASRWRR